MSSFYDLALEGLSPSIGPIVDPVTGTMTTAADLHQREKAAERVAASLPPRQLRIVKLAYESVLHDFLCTLGHKCHVRSARLPIEIATGKKSVKEVEDELFGIPEREW